MTGGHTWTHLDTPGQAADTGSGSTAVIILVVFLHHFSKCSWFDEMFVFVISVFFLKLLQLLTSTCELVFSVTKETNHNKKVRMNKKKLEAFCFTFLSLSRLINQLLYSIRKPETLL